MVFSSLQQLLDGCSDSVRFFLFLARWLRITEYNAPVEIDGANALEYRPTLDDVNATLAFLYTPVSLEGNRGKAQQTITAVVKAGTDRLCTGTDCSAHSNPLIHYI